MIINNANLTFDAMSKRNITTLLVLHHAAGDGPVEQIHDFHRKTRGWSGIGYHFYVRKDGSVWQGRPSDTVGAHTLDYNSISIAVCFEGNFETELMSDAQKNAGAELVAYIRQLYPTIAEIKSHGELKNTACPGVNFPFEEIVNGAVMTQAPEQPRENKVKQFQVAAIADGFSFPKFGADGMWGSETESVARNAICKKRATYKYPNLTKIVQREVGVEADGKFGTKTRTAVIAYQRANGLTPDAAWGVNCWRHFAEV